MEKSIGDARQRIYESSMIESVPLGLKSCEQIKEYENRHNHVKTDHRI